jgi:hypothetical protein
MLADGWVVMVESRGFGVSETRSVQVFAGCSRDFLRPITNDVTGCPAGLAGVLEQG